MAKPEMNRLFITQAERVLRQVYMPRITKCLTLLSVEQIWWRPNQASNSVGNLVLHLTGNVRQWIISGLGGAPDVRQRDQEFSESGPLPRRVRIPLKVGSDSDLNPVTDSEVKLGVFGAQRRWCSYPA